MRHALVFWLLLSGSGAALLAGAPEGVQLARDGKALMPVVVADGASDRVRQAATELASYLGKIAGAMFEVKAGDGRTGIAIGLPVQFPASPFGGQWAKPAIAEREDYLIRTHPQGVCLLGATELAAEHAVWDLLYRLGYRQFFPGERWEVVPRQADLSAAIDARESPSYRSRRIWYGYGGWDYAAKPYALWCARNRATSGMELHTGHAYEGIIRANKAEFDKHPEYYALVGGQRRAGPNPKLCISNPELRQLVARHALAQFERDPALDSISMDPSDGGGWCECEACAKAGSVSGRVVMLANEVAEAVNAKFQERFVGIYAYNYHSPPPSLRVHPRVIVSVATAFLKGGLALDEILSGWSRQGATLGIREYYSVNTWDRDQPGHARGGSLDYLRRTIPDFHAKGARFMSAESSDNWGPNGLGYYLAARMLWDVRQAQQTDALVEDFLERAFGAAKEPMREFYRQLDGSKPPLVVHDQLGRVFRALEQARALAAAPEVRARVDDLALYARYASLYHHYATADGDARQRAFEDLIRHAYRMRTTMLVHAKALYRDLAARDKSVKLPPEAAWNVPEGKNPWKSSAPFTKAETAGYVAEGIRSHPLAALDFKPVAYSSDLVLAAAALKLPEAPPGEFGPGRGTQAFFTYVEKAPADLELQVTGGLIPHYRDRGNVRVELWKVGGPSQTGERETLVATDRGAPPDGAEHTVKLAAREPGLHRLVVNDGNDRTLVAWKPGLLMTVQSSQDAPMNPHHGMWTACFYVPKGTKVIGLFGGGHGEVHDSRGRAVFWLNGRERNFYSVAVPEGQDGALWRIRYGRGDIRLLTVPPYFARSPQELLLPAEVVKRDAAP
ncbi:MAG TPA: DUF4838 domain-containing protein [Planctomycetota bacterium]|nr:DUF4838 domain-containing protein [Planctomycetota bacterium]